MNTKSPLQELSSIAESIANDHKLPARIVDWADDMYTRLLDPEASVLVSDLNILDAMSKDLVRGIQILDHVLAAYGNSGYGIVRK